MERYLVDTNVVSHYLSDLFSHEGSIFMDYVVNEVTQLSIITKIELFCWKTDREQIVKNFVEESTVYNITDDVIQQCVNIRKSRKIKTPDAIIAATALTHNCILITDNVRDFSNVKGLKLINPHTL